MTVPLFSSGTDLEPELVEAAREELRYRLPELKGLPGFPNGSDEDILAMSVPPHYTACPNPFIQDWLDASKPDGYDSRVYQDPGPFAADVSEGKGHSFYKAHVFWTKVPHEAIMRYILHYTQPGDVVLDGFSGSGMTGVAAQACADPDEAFRADVESSLDCVKWGSRRAVLQDLSPIASFIAAGLNLPLDSNQFIEAADRMLDTLDSELGWMYETHHTDGTKVRFDYVVWSEIFTCPTCGSEVVFYDDAFDEVSEKLRDVIRCASCGSELSKQSLERRLQVTHTLAGDSVNRVSYRPVRIAYRWGGAKFLKEPDEFDRELLRRCSAESADWFPTTELPVAAMWHGYNFPPRGISHYHHMFDARPLQSLAFLWKAANAERDPATRLSLLFWVEQAIWGLSWMNRYSPSSYSQVNRFRKGVFYFSSLLSECSPWYNLEGSSPNRGKKASLARTWQMSPAKSDNVMISTGSSSVLGMPSDSVDYIFVDPPFGLNFPYADLNLVLELWHGVATNVDQEAVVHRVRGVDTDDYAGLLVLCFREFFRVLKPGRWMTVEFSNSSNEIWMAIQDSLAYAGFVVADTRILDKGTISERQRSAKNAVKRDLIISAYKPSVETVERFSLVGGTPEGAWEFVREHLGHLPVVEGTRGEARVVRERMADRLYDRMVAYHVHRGVTVPLTAAEFYSGLEQRFPVRDDMYFLSEQVEGYERHRMTVKDLVQAELFITNEQSAVQWLRQLLKRRPASKAEIQPAFLSELQIAVSDWEAMPDLQELLEASFVQDDKDRWYVPDPKKSQDLEKLRTKSLLREFEVYLGGKGKLERFRSEAVRAGFKDAWGRRDFATIVTVGKRLPDDAFVEDEALLYYFDNAQRLTP